MKCDKSRFNKGNRKFIIFAVESIDTSISSHTIHGSQNDIR